MVGLGLCVSRDSLGVNGSAERALHGLRQLDVLVVVAVDRTQALCEECADVGGQLSDSFQCQSACQARLRLRVEVVVLVLVNGQFAWGLRPCLLLLLVVWYWTGSVGGSSRRFARASRGACTSARCPARGCFAVRGNGQSPNLALQLGCSPRHPRACRT
jgi:hypothetical protein